MRICVFDLSSLFWRYASSGGKRPLGEAAERTVGRVVQLADGFDRVVHCCDAGPSWRKAIDAGYKAKRPEHDAAMIDQYRHVQATLEAMGHVVIVAREHPEHAGLYLEADDEIAAVVAWAKARTHSVQIVTADKDLLRLVDDESDVWCRNPDKNPGVCNVDGVFKCLGVAPAKVTDLLALGGDSSDGFKPFPGIGGETAMKLVNAYGSAPAALTSILSGAEPLVTLKAPMLAALKAGGAHALDRGFQLATLLVVPGLDFARIEAEPVKREPLAQPALAWRAATPVAREPAADLVRSPRPSPVPAAPPRAQDVPEASWEESRSVAMVRRAPAEFALELEPRCPEDAVAMADTLARANLFQVKRPEQVFAAILLARSFGLPAITVLQSVHVIDGKLSLPASLIVGLILKSGKASMWKLVDSSNDKCTIKTKRADDPDPDQITFTYTAEDASAAGLLGKDNWRKYRRAMLRHRCEVDLARAVYPDVVCNLYTPDELGDAGPPGE